MKNANQYKKDAPKNSLHTIQLLLVPVKFIYILEYHKQFEKQNSDNKQISSLGK